MRSTRFGCPAPHITIAYANLLGLVAISARLDCIFHFEMHPQRGTACAFGARHCGAQNARTDRVLYSTHIANSIWGIWSGLACMYYVLINTCFRPNGNLMMCVESGNTTAVHHNEPFLYWSTLAAQSQRPIGCLVALAGSTAHQPRDNT